LYAVTQYGGTYNGGSAFSFNLSTGAFNTLFSFNGASGTEPNPGLLYQDGLLYGTTFTGGYTCARRYGGCGVIFSIDPSTGAESTYHTFQKKNDGAYPYSNLVYHDGSLIGAVALGGSKTCRVVSPGVV
jgi:uncharacterized repeat protein (TIGR03803 family)